MVVTTLDRAIRFTLFGFGILVGALFVILSGESPDDGQVARRSLELIERQSTPTEEPDFAALAIRERSRGERRAAVITAAFSAEDVDPKWAPVTEQEIVDRWATEGPPESRLISATCKTTLCIAEIDTRSGAPSIGPLFWQRLSLPRGFVFQADIHRTIVFLAREGHSLPEMTHS
jgi:hypothetical protein